MEYFTEKETFEIQKVVMPKKEFNKLVGNANIKGRSELANELGRFIGSYPYKLNIYGQSKLLSDLSDIILYEMNK